MIRVAVVDDQDMVREGFSSILRGHPDLDVALEAAHGQQLVDAVRRDPRIDVALVDIRMPVMDGLAATRAVTALPHAPRIIIVTTFAHDEYVLEAIAAGACGFLLKRSSAQTLVGAIRTVVAGGSILAPDVTAAVMARIRATGTGVATDLEPFGLTTREHEVLALVGRGLNNTEIAARLHLSVSSVKTHVGALLAKTGSRDRVQLALLTTGATGGMPDPGGSVIP